MKLTLDSLLEDLGDEKKPIRYSGLVQLSDLSQEQLIDFQAAWPSVPWHRTREIIEKLIELSDENLELDFSAIFKLCLNSPDEEIREKATRGLWECEDRSIIRPLVRVLQADPSPKVRAAAATSLQKFAGKAQHDKLLSRDIDRIRDALIKAIGRAGEDVEVKRRAIEAVANFSVPEVDGIIKDAYKSGDLQLKQSSIYAMGQSSKTMWLPIVLEEMNHPQPEIRYEATTACGLLGEESSVPHLIKLLEDEDVEVQTAAVKALGMIGGVLAKQALLQCLKLGDLALEDAAQDALKEVEFGEDPLGFRFYGWPPSHE